MWSKLLRYLNQNWKQLVHPARFERATFAFGGRNAPFFQVIDSTVGSVFRKSFQSLNETRERQRSLVKFIELEHSMPPNATKLAAFWLRSPPPKTKDRS